jgi:hypothetical protein
MRGRPKGRGTRAFAEALGDSGAAMPGFNRDFIHDTDKTPSTKDAKDQAAR